MKRGLTQKEMGEKVGKHCSTWCEYENANSHVPKRLALEIPTIFSFSNYEKGKFKKFLVEAEKKVERRDRSKGKKNHVVKGGWKKKTSGKNISQKPITNGQKQKDILSKEDRKNLRFLKTFLKNGGKEDLIFLSKLRKFVARQR